MQPSWPHLNLFDRGNAILHRIIRATKARTKLLLGSCLLGNMRMALAKSVFMPGKVRVKFLVLCMRCGFGCVNYAQCGKLLVNVEAS